jgi:hypothetical protein
MYGNTTRKPFVQLIYVNKNRPQSVEGRFPSCAERHTEDYDNFRELRPHIGRGPTESFSVLTLGSPRNKCKAEEPIRSNREVRVLV